MGKLKRKNPIKMGNYMCNYSNQKSVDISEIEFVNFNDFLAGQITGMASVKNLIVVSDKNGNVGVIDALTREKKKGFNGLMDGKAITCLVALGFNKSEVLVGDA